MFDKFGYSEATTMFENIILTGYHDIPYMDNLENLYNAQFQHKCGFRTWGLHGCSTIPGVSCPVEIQQSRPFL